MNHPLFEELRELIDAMIDQSITDRQTERLNEILASDSTAVDFYIQQMWMHEDLLRLAGENSTKIDASIKT